MYKRVAYPEVRAEGGTHTRYRTSKRNAEHLGTEWSGGRSGTPLLEGRLGGPPPRKFFKSSHEMLNSGSIWKSLNGYKFATVCPIFKIKKADCPPSK